MISAARSNRHLCNMIRRSQVAAFSTESLKVVHEPTNARFVTKINNDIAVLDYDKRDKNFILLHTEVPDVFRGKGVAQLLAKEAFDYAIKNKLDVELQCDYLQSYYKKNQDLYAEMSVKHKL